MRELLCPVCGQVVVKHLPKRFLLFVKEENALSEGGIVVGCVCPVGHMFFVRAFDALEDSRVGKSVA